MEEPKRGLGEAIAALGRLRATGDTKHVFEITRALSSRKPPAGYARLLTTPQGGRMAYERVELCERFGDDVWLRSFAAGTVGAAYRDFITRNNISAAGLADASARAAVGQPEYRHPHAWYGRRNRDIHDVWHVLTGYGTDGLGEGCVVAFSYAQTGSLGLAFIALHVARSGKQARPDLPFFTAVWRAYLVGRRAAWLPGEDYERLFAEPLESARGRLGISPPDTYRQILRAFAPQMAAAA
ncbi:MAG: ubiquinone biosynthesis protein [Phenylobacterium sp.]|uniref:Coq4 family protein n=1 Tax=Phenylobacterium sp. TaxID=1871053 RepID=UPI001B7A30E0|nr:Coq4 family protein [Phenylobacterium sp.]MBP7650439.1 ubiquinone biosynthesis protein [Phenylobacterium sp.]MBP7814754.1 ubiquinone biosynthesis protein [Phenylobacterium sp.]MBP8248312.1 ubiquinone biosynthesis protein [Phenylobacterium sp.]